MAGCLVGAEEGEVVPLEVVIDEVRRPAVPGVVTGQLVDALLPDFQSVAGQPAGRFDCAFYRHVMSSVWLIVGCLVSVFSTVYPIVGVIQLFVGTRYLHCRMAVLRVGSQIDSICRRR